MHPLPSCDRYHILCILALPAGILRRNILMAVHRIGRLVKFPHTFCTWYVLTPTYVYNRLRPVKRVNCPLPEAVIDTKGLRGRPNIGVLMVWAVDRNWPDALMEVFRLDSCCTITKYCSIII